MSMLAADRRTRKLQHLLPKGNKPLYEDESRFGFRIMQKMGWSKDKGLGANEDGAKEFVRVKFKDNNDGIGYKERDDQWTQHEESFNELLRSLHNSMENSDADDEDGSANGFSGFGCMDKDKDKQHAQGIDEEPTISGESLENKSKKSRVRVHYKKFTRGKDISQYSEKDLANIFGKKNLNEKVGEKRKAEKIEELDRKEETLLKFGVETINSGNSLESYFKQKMALLKSKNKTITDQKDETSLERNSNSASMAFAEDEKVDECGASKTKKKKKLSKIKEDDDHQEVSQEKNLEQNIHDEDKCKAKEIEPKKKKGKKNKNESCEGESVMCQSVESNICKELGINLKKRRKQPEFEDENLEKSENCAKESNNEQQPEKLDNNEVDKKSKKTKEKKTTEADSDAIVQEKSSEMQQEDKNTSENEAEMDGDDDGVYKISSLAAERFRWTNLDDFKGSNIKELPGYGLNENFKLEISASEKNTLKIADLWNSIERGKKLKESKTKKFKAKLKSLKKRKAFANVC